MQMRLKYTAYTKTKCLLLRIDLLRKGNCAEYPVSLIAYSKETVLILERPSISWTKPIPLKNEMGGFGGLFPATIHTIPL